MSKSAAATINDELFFSAITPLIERWKASKEKGAKGSGDRAKKPKASPHYAEK